MEEMQSCHFTAPFHVSAPILNPPLLMLPKAVASQASPPWLSTANGDVHLASLVYQAAPQLPWLPPAIIPHHKPGAWGSQWRCCSNREPGRKRGIYFFFHSLFCFRARTSRVGLAGLSTGCLCVLGLGRGMKKSPLGSQGCSCGSKHAGVAKGGLGVCFWGA